MDLAILYWFYKEPEVSLNHLKLLKHHNSDIKVFGLFGGEQNEQYAYKSLMGNLIDDFYTSSTTGPDWKWINGDLLLLDWYKNQGKNLLWDSVAIIQWDMLVFDSLNSIFSGMKKDEIFLSGLKILDPETENRWDWTRPGGKERQNYLDFYRYVRKEYDYNENPLCCLFILEILPRVFFEKYLHVKNREVGMLEYKIPIYAKIFGLKFYEKDIGVWWYQMDRNQPLNALPEEIPTGYIKSELAKPLGWRIFHPYYKLWKIQTL